MIRVERFQISNLWGSKNITLNFHKNFAILTGHNGSGKSTILEFLHDSFCLIHDGEVETSQESWASELIFSDKTLVRSFFLDGEVELNNELKKKVESSAEASVDADVFEAFAIVNATIKDHPKKKTKNYLLRKILHQLL